MYRSRLSCPSSVLFPGVLRVPSLERAAGVASDVIYFRSITCELVGFWLKCAITDENPREVPLYEPVLFEDETLLISTFFKY